MSDGQPGSRFSQVLAWRNEIGGSTVIAENPLWDVPKRSVSSDEDPARIRAVAFRRCKRSNVLAISIPVTKMPISQTWASQ
jgi:hypothetical protein